MAGLIGRGIIVSFGIATLAASAPIAAQAPAQLTPQDYMEIQQLTARYVYVVDHCTNSGYDYADLYTPDGTFGVKQAVDGPGVIWARGREALAKAGGGGPGGCHERKPGTPGYGLHHVVTSETITPAPGGATGRSTLITFGVADRPDSVEWQGGYRDVYEKTPQGWRIKSRWHVWPNLRHSIQLTTHPLPASLLPPEPAAKP